MLIERPCACSLSKLDVDPGTRVMSPNVAIVTPGTRERAMTVSISLLEVTQTGHPGPEANRMPSGIMVRKPLRAIATVCVPQTSINVACSGAHFSIECMSPLANSGSRKTDRFIVRHFSYNHPPAQTTISATRSKRYAVWSPSISASSGNSLIRSRVS